MKSESYICPNCGKPDDLRISWWKRLDQCLRWRCPHCGKNLEAIIARTWQYYFWIAALVTASGIIAFTSGDHLMFISGFYISKIALDLISSKTRNIRISTPGKLSRFETEELADNQL